MKTWILLLLAGLLGTTAAQAQISFYGEWRREHKGGLHSKVWVTPEFSRSEYTDEKGETSVTILDVKKATAYIISPANKKIMVLNNLRNLNVNDMLGLKIEKSRRTEKEYLGIDDVDGRPCKKYNIVGYTTSELTGEESVNGAYYDWIYEPMVASNYNGSIKTDNTIYTMDRCIVLRNIRMGPQPTHLFEIPEGYTVMEIPKGGLMEMITGKPREENQQNFDDTRDAFKKKAEEIKSATEGQDKSQEEKIKALLEMMGGQKKK